MRVFISHEKELAVFVQHLDRAGAAIAHLGNDVRCKRAYPCAFGFVEAGGWAFLNHLLVAALDRTIAFAQMDRIALAIPEHLHLDVARRLQIAFHIDGVVAEIGLGFGARPFSRPAPARRRFARLSCPCRRRRSMP